MDAALNAKRSPPRGLLITGLAPVVPQLLGSAFNIAYNKFIVDPLLTTDALRDRFLHTVIGFNVLIYPVAVAAWLAILFSLRDVFIRLANGEELPAERLMCARRRVVHLPWLGAAVSGLAWLLCIPVFLISLLSLGQPLSTPLLWHLPISFLVSAFIAITQSFFLIEIASHWNLFPVFFRDARPDQLTGIYPLSLRARGLMWAASVGICPIGSLLLLDFAPPSPAGHPVWFAVFVGSIGIAFGLCSAVMLARLVVDPVDQLRGAMQALAAGRFDTRLPLRRADEFGALIGGFNVMAGELQEKERLRQTFGSHVGRKAAAEILARDPGLGGREQNVTVIFVDIRAFTARAARSEPQRIVAVLNEFLREMVTVVEEEHGGMINKFLGDGFMALFGVGTGDEAHADKALLAGRAMLARLEQLNARFCTQGEAPLAIGIGIHTGPAIVGSIGSPERMEFTAIGTTPNLAARLEALTKSVGEALLLSETTRHALRETVALRELPPQLVKGLQEPIRIWTFALSPESPLT